MDNEQERTAEQLRALGEKIRAGWAKTHVIKPKHMQAVKAAVREQWQQKHGKSIGQAKQAARIEVAKAKSKSQPQARERVKKSAQEQEKRKSQDHGRSR